MRDTLRATAGVIGGDDTLIGGAGDDLLWGGGGHDHFEYYAYANQPGGSSGNDVIEGLRSPRRSNSAVQLRHELC